MAKSEDSDEPTTPIVDELVSRLPKIDGIPQLALFILTHPDTDHCQGFRELQKKVAIGELWFSPRIFSEYKKELGDDAVAFQNEAKRRVAATIAARGDASAGDRVRIIGYDDVLEREEFRGFPKTRLTIPGTEVTEVNGEDVSAIFRAFVHAPFRKDQEGERNDTSIGLQVTVKNGEGAVRALLLGDLVCPILKRIFKFSDAGDLAWDLLLAPHHCSKSVMFIKDENGDEVFQQDIMTSFEEASLSGARIICSSDPIPARDEKGQNPPHRKARTRYEAIVPAGHFLCTGEHPDTKNPIPIEVVVTATGGQYSVPRSARQLGTGASLGSAVAAAQGNDRPPERKVGYGA